MPDPPNSPPLSRIERINVVFVLAASQLAQILMVAAVTAAIYCDPRADRADARRCRTNGPAPTSDNATMLRTHAAGAGFADPYDARSSALTFMYVSARAAGDDDYRSTFLDPLIDDLHATLIARNRYRGAVAGAGAMLTPPNAVINFTLE